MALLIELFLLLLDDAHNQQLLVKTGDTVTNGSPIAIAGNTGSLDSTGVYFALPRQGRPENPEPWLQ